MPRPGDGGSTRTEAREATRIAIPADALIIVIAPSGAGKSTFVRRHFRPTEIVSSDHCRALVADDESNQRATAPAFDVFHAIIRGRLSMGRLAVADATNLDREARRKLREVAAEHGRPIVAVVLDVPLERSVAQNNARRRQVPPHILELHYHRFEAALKALPGEGYASIHRVQPGSAVRILRQPAAVPDGSSGPG